MTTRQFDFSDQQWDFLALLDAFSAPVSIDILGELVPLTPGPLFDLIKRGKAMGIVRQSADNCFSLAAEIPQSIRNKLDRVNTPQQLANLVQQLERSGLAPTLAGEVREGLLVKSENPLDAAVLCYDNAQKSLRKGLVEQALTGFQRTIQYLQGMRNDQSGDALLIACTLELSQLIFRLGRGFDGITRLLDEAGSKAENCGDKRSLALIGLHLGRYYFLNDRLSDGINGLTQGLKQVRELGDEDILGQSAEFFGYNYYLQGEYKKACQYFEQALQEAELKKEFYHRFPVSIFYAFCNLMLGRFHRAIGFLDSTWRRARNDNELVISNYARLQLTLGLLILGKFQEAQYHLKSIEDEITALHSDFLQGMVDLVRSYLFFTLGRPMESYQSFCQAKNRLDSALIPLKQYPIPGLLEMLYMYHKLGYQPVPGLDYPEEIKRILAEQNIHLKGVAHRLVARQQILKLENYVIIERELNTSMNLLTQSGDPLETAKTRIELARLKCRQNDLESATTETLKAWEDLSGLGSHYFPDDLKYLLKTPSVQSSEQQFHLEILERSLDIIRQPFYHPGVSNLLNTLLEGLNEFLRAERGGVFLFSDRSQQPLELAAARNLSSEEVHTEAFRERLAKIFSTFRSQKPHVTTRSRPTPESSHGWFLCIPFKTNPELQGVLYHDSSYLENRFAFPDGSFLEKLTALVNSHIETISGLLTRQQAVDNHLQDLPRKRTDLFPEIITGDPFFKQILKTVDKAALSDSTILITGETGVGKELVARRVHQKSAVAVGPFVVVDLTSIPENLVESELFGHEKGAFTGADRQKKGRFEMADGGTLFIDELGEIPPALQVKLLRVIQERTFSRVGGSRVIGSSFRLIAATNRDLKAEVAAGRFREDLYYRLSVIPVHLPPLRNRGNDVGMLANHFLETYFKKRNRPVKQLSAANEATLHSYHWPGNIRELKNVIERAVLMSDDHEDLLLSVTPKADMRIEDLFADAPTLDELQRRYIRWILEQTGAKISGPGGAAEKLGMKRTSLYARMKRLGMR